LREVELEEEKKLGRDIVEDVSHLRGKYGKRKVDLQELRDEIYDRMSHLR
jgi:hypothetical protein